MQKLYVVHTVRSDNRVKGVWIVKADSCEAAETAFKAINAEQLAMGDAPLIPEDGYVTAEPLELEDGIQQLW